MVSSGIRRLSLAKRSCFTSLQSLRIRKGNAIAARISRLARKKARFTESSLSFGRAPVLIIGTFRSDYDYEYEYEFFNVYPVRMPDCVRLSSQLVLSSKSRRRLDANYEIFNKTRPPTTSSLQVQRRVKRLVFKGADTL